MTDVKLNSNERERKSAESSQTDNEPKFVNKKLSVQGDQQENLELSKNLKSRRSSAPNGKSLTGSSEELTGQKSNDNQVSSNASKNKKRNTVSRYYDQTYEDTDRSEKIFNNREKTRYQKRSDESNALKNYKTIALGNNVASSDSDINNKARYENTLKQRSLAPESSSNTAFINNGESEKDRASREISYHTNTKKDISRLLHSFGFSVENVEKDKIKEMKKKLKGKWKKHKQEMVEDSLCIFFYTT